MIPLFKARDVRNRIAVWMSDAASMIILFGTGIYMACISWQRWADITIDYGVELYIPWQLTKGKVLYHDIWQLYGPFSQYFNSMVFKVFGVGFMNLALFNIILIVVLAYIIYRIFFKLSDKLTATLITAFFLSVFAFSQYVGCANYNFVCPYSHELTHGLLLSFAAIYIFMNFIRSGNILSMFFIGMLTGLILLTKLESFCAIIAAMGAGLACYAIINRARVKEILKAVGVFAAGFFLPTVFFLIFFSGQMGIQDALKAMMWQYTLLFEKSVVSEKFPLWVVGLDRPEYNFKMLLLITARYGYLILLTVLVVFLISKLKNGAFRRGTKALVLAALFLLIPSVINKTPWMEMGRPLPVFALMLSVYYFMRILLSIRDRQKAGSLLPFLVLSVFSFVMLFKIILNARLYHYGFVLALPASLLSVMFFVYQMPDRLGKLFGNKVFIRSINVILVVAVMIAHVGMSRRLYGFKIFQFSSGVDAMKTWGEHISLQGPCGRLALEEMAKVMKKGETFVVFPEGVLYNYLARHDNPTPYYDFKPVPVQIWGKEYLESLKKNNPDYIVLTDRDTSDIGARYFGRDYGKDIYSWITENYKAVFQTGYPLSGAGFGVLIAKRENKAGK